MPLEERLRHALTDQAASVRVDVEGPLAQVHRRRGRAAGWKAAAAAAAVVAVVAGTTAVLGTEPERPAPSEAPNEPTSAPVDPVPVGTYSRSVTVDEAHDAGFPRGEVRHLFHGGEQVRVLMQFRDPRHLRAGRNSWFVRFVDDDGRSRVRDGGTYYYGNDGELTIVSRWIDCLGCNYHFTFDVEHGQLSLETTPGSQAYMVATLLEGGAWQRLRP